MDSRELAAQFGGTPVDSGAPDLAAQFGGVPVQQASPDEDLAKQFGGVPVPAAPTPEEPKKEEPTVFQRVKDIAAAPIEAVMGKDVFKEGAQEPSPIKGSVKKGILNVEQSVLQNQLASLMDLQAADKEKYGEYYAGAPANQLDKITARDKAIQDKLREVADLGLKRKAIDDKEGVFELSKSLKDLYGTKEYQDSSFLEGLGMIGNKIASNPSGIPGWIASVGVESLPQSMATVVAAMAARAGGMGPRGAMIAGGSGSSFMEFGGQYADLRAQGMSHQEAWEKAGVKSGVIGLFDAASFNSAGKAASSVLGSIEKGALKETAKQVGKEVGLQSIYGGAGEALGSIAINQKVDPGAVLEEMVGEVFGAPVEAVSTYQEEKAKGAGVPPPAPKQPSEVTTPPVELKPAAEQFREEAQTRYQELGLSRKDAERLANEDAKEAGYEPGVITGTREPSIQTPNVEDVSQGPAAGITGTEPGQLGGTSGITGDVGVGAETQRGALEPVEEAPKVSAGRMSPLYKAAMETLAGFKTELETATPEEATVLERKIKDMNVYLGVLEKEGRDVVQEEVATPTAAKEVVEATGAPLPAPVVTKGKAGRPKAVLTPEQAAAKAEARKVSQAGTRDAIRLAERSQKILDTEAPNPEDFESLDAADLAQTEYLQTRRQALEDAYTLSVTPAHRNNKAGTLAKAMLEKATPQERELAKNRYEMKQKLNLPSRTEITESTNGEDNTKYESFNNAKSALNWLAKNGNEFERILAKRLAPYLNGVKLVVVDSHLDLPSKSLQNSMNGAAGLYVPGRNTIYLLRNGGTNNTVFLHEALHGATVKRINAYLQAKLEGRAIPNDLRVAVAELMETMDEARQLYDTLRAQGVLSDAMLAIPYDAFTDIKEFVSYGLTLPAMQDFLALAPGEYAGEAPGFISKLFSKFVQGLRKMFDMGEDHTSALQDLIIITDKLLRIKEQETVSPTEEANAAKKASKKAAKVDKDLEKIRISNNAFDTTGSIGDIIREGHSFEDFKTLLNAKFPAMENEFIKKLLYGLQTVDILRWKGDEIPGLNEVDTLQQEMAAMRTHMLNASAKKGDRLGAFIRKNGMKTLGDTMHLARLKKVSPTKAADAAAYIAQDPVIQNYNKMMADPNTTPAQKIAYKGKITTRTNDINAVYDAWAKLGKQKGGHEMYNMVRQFYIDNYTATRTLLNDQLNALPIDADAKANLLKSVRLMHEQAKKGTDEDFDGMEVQALPEEYFPFKREGKYWLRVDKGPTGREFYLFENGAARNLFLARRAKELGQSIDDPNFSAGDDITSLRQNFQDSSVMLQQMFASIDEATTDPKFDTSKFASAEEAGKALKEELKDQIYQVYLMTLPERSFRKQFLHAENITGFSADVFRNFKTSATAFANQLAKLKYGTDITNSVQRARDSLEGMPALDRAKLELFVNEIGQRAQEEINPPETGQVVTRVNQFAFLWLLTSAASAATQMASVPIMVMPSLNAEYGYGASAKAFAKYTQLWKSMGITEVAPNGDVSYTAPSIGSSQMVKDNPVLQRAFEAALDRHVTTLTNTSVLTNRNRTPDSSYASIPGTAARIAFNGMTALFNGSERMSRELTYMMAFELEYAKTKDFQKSVDRAVDITHELLGRYDNFNRPRILRNAFGKTVGQFKQYSVFMTSFFMRNAHEIFSKGMLDAEGREAMHRLAGVLVMGGMFHGLVGFPLYSTICATIDAFFDGDEEEKKRRRLKNPLTSDDSNLRFRYDWLPEHFGQVTIPGLDGRQHRLSDVLEKGPISALTDINIGSRTSFDGLWFRAAKPGKNYLETAQNYILANLGPGVSTGVNMVGAIDDFIGGHIDRGLEKLVPAFFKGSLVANRMAREGAETRGGADMLKPSEINTLNLIATTLGFQPARLARIQERNFEMQKQVTEAQNERAKILKRLDETVFDPERGAKEVKSIFNSIREYNKRYPVEKFLITNDTISSSLDAYAQKRGLTYRGAYMDKKLIPYLMPSAKAAAPLE